MSVTIEMDVYKCFEQFSNFTIVLMSQLLIVYSFFLAVYTSVIPVCMPSLNSYPFRQTKAC